MNAHMKTPKSASLKPRPGATYIKRIRQTWYWVAPRKIRLAGYPLKTVRLDDQDGACEANRLQQADSLTKEAFAWLRGEGQYALEKLETEQFMHLLELAVKSARGRAKKRGLKFTITSRCLFDLLETQGRRCALTGVRFDPTPSTSDSFRSPNRPSVDRIEKTEGYTIGNVRLTTVIANMARSDYGDEAFYEMCVSGAVERLRQIQN